MTTNISDNGSAFRYAVQGGAEISAESVSKTDKLKHIVKAVKGVMIIAGTVSRIVGCGAIADAFQSVAKTFGLTDTTIKSVAFIERFAEWTNKEKVLSFMKDKVKLVQRITLTIAQIMDPVSFLEAINVLKYASLGGFVIGSLPVFSFVKDSFMLTSSVLGIVCTSKKMSKDKEKKEIIDFRVKKWDNPESHGYDKVKIDITNSIAKFKREHKVEELKEKRIKYEEESKDLNIQLKTAGFLDAIRLERNKKQVDGKKDEVQNLLDRLNHKEAMVKALENEDDKVKHKVIDYKIEKNNICLENCKKDKKISWFGIAADVAKIVMITLGIALLATGVGALGLAAVTITVAALGIIASSLGLLKSLYPDFAGKKEKIKLFNYEQEAATAA